GVFGGPRCPWCSTEEFLWSRRWRLGGQAVVGRGGALMLVNRRAHPVSHGHCCGRCKMYRRAEEAIRAGIVTSFLRIVAVVARASPSSAIVAAARVRLNARTAHTNHAAFAVNMPEGRCASALFFRSAWTCSMIAWPRWVLSADTVSRLLVVKNAWNRWVSNRVGCSRSFLFSSGIRRTTSRPGTRWCFFFEVKAVKSTSATSAEEIQEPVSSS